jgi:hypothetical protein
MNLVGKIFTVLIFLMCIVFSTFAIAVHATHKNWMADDEIKAKSLSDARTENSELTKKKKEIEDQLQMEKTRNQAVLAELETKNVKLSKESEANGKRIRELETQVNDAVATTKAVHVTLAALRTEADKLREENKTARADRDDIFKKIVALTDQINNVAAERLRLEKTNRDLTDELAKARECFNYYKINYKGDYKGKEPPVGLEGQVTDASHADLIEISIGSDDGLRVGHKMEVVRLGAGVKTYVGRVQVMNVSPDRAACRPDPAMLRSPIQRGDRVYANLSQVR